MTAQVSNSGPAGNTQYDAVIVGAGVAGLYQLHQLRERGLHVRVYDSASDVGGTWYWNRYPGAKFDSECFIYQYLFDEDLYKDWSWSERFPAQPEIERWMQYVADKLDLRRDIEFDTAITRAVFDDTRGRWTIETDGGETLDAQYFISCAGMLSAPLESTFAGQDSFEGRIFHTARWPREPIEFAGKRVGVVGIGATGIQVIQTIADQVGHLKVFVRTPQYISPMKNPRYSEADIAAYKARFAELRDKLPHTFSGFNFEFSNGDWASQTDAERMAVFERMWEDGSLRLWLASYPEIFTDQRASDMVSDFVRDKMRARLKDPALCELLIPTDYGFGTHRVPLESDYLEVYHRDNVEAIGVRDNPIKRVTPIGIELTDGTVHELDVIILATGFDAGSGALTRIDIRGRDGRSLKDEWSRDIRTAMGLAVHGYPNLFTTGAPLAPSAALCNMTTCLQQQTEWISDCITHARRNEVGVIEASEQLQDDWVAHHDEIANATLVTKTNSWYMGSNVEGKPRRLLSYIGGVGQYRQKCSEVAAQGYAGFDMR